MNPFPSSSPAARLYSQIQRDLPRLGLVAGMPKSSRTLNELHRIGNLELLGRKTTDEQMASLVRAGLLLRADHVDASHSISQKVSVSEGSYWHGILHRREPDYPNAKYWFERVREHPVFTELSSLKTDSMPLGGVAWKEIARRGRWDPSRFVDLCEACEEGKRADLREELEWLEELEIDLLLKFCASLALGMEPGKLVPEGLA